MLLKLMQYTWAVNLSILVGYPAHGHPSLTIILTFSVACHCSLFINYLFKFFRQSFEKIDGLNFTLQSSTVFIKCKRLISLTCRIFIDCLKTNKANATTFLNFYVVLKKYDVIDLPDGR